VTIAATLDFVPAELLPFPVYRGIQVAVTVRNVSPQDQEAIGAPVNIVGLAAVTQVAVQVRSCTFLPDGSIPLTRSTSCTPTPHGVVLQHRAESPVPACVLPWRACSL
jgi:hypothetical protein